MKKIFIFVVQRFNMKVLYNKNNMKANFHNFICLHIGCAYFFLSTVDGIDE